MSSKGFIFSSYAETFIVFGLETRPECFGIERHPSLSLISSELFSIILGFTKTNISLPFCNNFSFLTLFSLGACFEFFVLSAPSIASSSSSESLGFAINILFSTPT